MEAKRGSVSYCCLGLSLSDFYGDDEFFYLARIDDEVKEVNVVWDDDSFPVAQGTCGISKGECRYIRLFYGA